MNEKTAFTEWVESLTPALRNAGLTVELDTKHVCGGCLGNMSVTKEGAFPKEYHIRFNRAGQKVEIVAFNPYAKRNVRLKTYSLDNVAKIAEYAKHQVETWVTVTKMEADRLRRRREATQLAHMEEIDHLPAWALLQCHDDSDENKGFYRLSFRNYDVGYPLKRITPKQVKTVIHFLSRIDKPEIATGVWSSDLLEELIRLVSIICGGQRDVTIEDCDPAKQLILKITGKLELQENA